MLHNTALLTYASKAKPDNTAPVWTIRNLLGKKKKNAQKDTGTTSMPYCSSKLCHKCQHWHVTTCYKVKLTLNKAIYESCLSTTFFCLCSDKAWLIEPHTILQAATGLTLHLYILNCTDRAPWMLLPQKDFITVLSEQSWTKQWCKLPGLIRACRKWSVQSFLVSCRQSCSIYVW